MESCGRFASAVLCGTILPIFLAFVGQQKGA